MTREHMPDRLPERNETEPSAEEVKFVTGAMEEVSDSLSRYAITPTPDATLRIKEALAKDNFEEELAKALSGVVVIDSHFEPQNLTIENDQGLVDTAVLTRAKAKAVSKDVESNEIRRKLEEFGDRALLNVGKAVTSTGGRRGTAALAGGALALMMTSCGITGEAVGSSSVEAPEETGARTAEVTETLTQTSTEKPSVTPTETETPAPTETPTPSLPETFADQEAQQKVVNEFLEDFGYSSLEELDENINFNYKLGYGSDYEQGFGLTSDREGNGLMLVDFVNLGFYEIDISNQSFGDIQTENGNTAVICLGYVKELDMLVPIVLGFEEKGRWNPMVQYFNEVVEPGSGDPSAVKRLSFNGKPDFLSWMDENRGYRYRMWMYYRVADVENVQGSYTTNTQKEFLENTEGYVARYSIDDSLLDQALAEGRNPRMAEVIVEELDTEKDLGVIAQGFLYFPQQKVESK